MSLSNSKNLFTSAQHYHSQPFIMLKQFLPLAAFALFLLSGLASAQNTGTRSDTLDVLHYSVALNIVNLAPPLSGTTTLRIVPKINNLNTINLDLDDGFTVSGVTYNGATNSFTQNGALLHIPLAQAINPTDTINIAVTYSGIPPQASFGGFYFTSTYAYNLGVGIGVDPPTFGRAWFPCVDNFVEHATFEYYITTANNRKAFCGGLLQEVVTNADNTKTWHWTLSQQIPTYLASVAVSDYQTLTSSVQSIAGNTVPVQLGARAADTTDLKNSFVHLPDAFHVFEDAWGAYKFDRVGYVVVPFNGGAMEHACNIAYPTFAVDGTLTWEHQLMAHEFSHHWFGDLVTCQTAADMWLNEGWASYCESYFLEGVYGRDRYNNDMRKNNSEVMQYAHIRDGAHLPVAGVPFDATYGDHVYNKGASVVHSLRGYMGDDAFFDCVKQYLNTYAFKNTTTNQLRDFLSECSGKDLTNFFDDWAFSAGFANFTLDSTQVAFNPDNTYTAHLFVRQRLYAAPHYYQNVPIQITFFDSQLNPYTETFVVSGGCTQVATTLPFYPVYATLDWNQLLNDATTDQHLTLKQTGTIAFDDEKMSVTVSSITDSTLLHVSHHWVMPDRLDTPNPNLKLSPSRYWHIGGYQTGTFSASAVFTYNGSNSTSGGYLDNALISGSENNLRLLYRASSANDWTTLPSAQYTINTQGSSTDKKGSISLANLQFGEYTLAFANPTQADTLQTIIPDCIATALIPTPTPNLPFTVSPNPANDTVLVDCATFEQNTLLSVTDYLGRLMYQQNLTQPKTIINTQSWKNGLYFVQLQTPQSKQKQVIKLIVHH